MCHKMLMISADLSIPLLDLVANNRNTGAKFLGGRQK